MIRVGTFSLLALALIVRSFSVPLAALADPKNPASERPAFYVIADPKDLPAIVALSVADEFNKSLTGNYRMTSDGKMATNPVAWVIPEPSWTQKDLSEQCGDRTTLGGVIVTADTGSATHFWVLWQTQTTTFSLFAQLLACKSGKATIVGIIGHRLGAEEAPWVVRETQAGIPLFTIAALASIFASKNVTNSGETNLTLSAVAGSLLSNSATKDVPGYSEPVRLQRSGQHIGADVLNAMQWMCRTDTNAGGMRDDATGSSLCRGLGFTGSDKATTP